MFLRILALFLKAPRRCMTWAQLMVNAHLISIQKPKNQSPD